MAFSLLICIKTFHNEQKVSIIAVIFLYSSWSDKGTLSEVVYISLAPNLNEQPGGIKQHYLISVIVYVCMPVYTYT